MFATSVLGVIGSVQFVASVAIIGAVVALSGYALWHALTTPAGAFTSEGKRTRGFWLGLNALALVISFLALPPAGMVGLFGALMALIIPAVYLTDVRPAVAMYRIRKDGSGGSNSGGDYGKRPPTPW